jgi:transposase InsO family protein
MAEAAGIAKESLRRWARRREMPKAEQKKRGRPEAVQPEVRWRVRAKYAERLGQWGPSVLACWAEREGLGRFSPSTVARVVADLRPPREERPSAKRYEVAAPMVMWSEDGTAFKDGGRKRQLLAVHDEHARYTTGRRLAEGAANGEDVVSYLREAFARHGAPLVLKQDNGAALNNERVKRLCDEHGVVLLLSPPCYPPFNGKKERRFRDVKGFVRALARHRLGASIQERIDLALRDLDEERPRPVLGGRTAAEVFAQDRIELPDRRRFRLEVETRQRELEADAGSRTEIAAARRRAVMEVLSRHGLLIWKTGMSTDSKARTGTN